MTGLKKKIFGKTVVVNFTAKRLFRVSPGVNQRARAIQQCAKGKSLEQRKQCFGKKTGRSYQPQSK